MRKWVRRLSCVFLTLLVPAHLSGFIAWRPYRSLEIPAEGRDTC